MPPHFEDHAVWQLKGDLAFPVGYYSDGVPRAKNSFITFSWATLSPRPATQSPSFERATCVNAAAEGCAPW
eukprot:4885799-Pyramimonas_sp.AAC.1